MRAHVYPSYVLLLPSSQAIFNPITYTIELLFEAEFEPLIKNVLTPIMRVLSKGPVGIVTAQAVLVTPILTPVIPGYWYEYGWYVIDFLIQAGIYVFNKVIRWGPTSLTILWDIFLYWFFYTLDIAGVIGRKRRSLGSNAGKE